MVNVGQKAIDFTLKSSEKKLVSLSDYRGAYILLYFYPKNYTPGCTKEACEFRDQYSAFERLNAKVIGISNDDTSSHETFAAQYSLPFTLLSDPSYKTSSDYGVWKTKKILGTTFIIDPDGLIAKVYKNVKVKDHVAAVYDDLLALLETANG